MGVWVIAVAAGVDVLQQLTRLFIIRFHVRFGQTVVGETHGEVHRGELPRAHRFGNGVVAQQLGGKAGVGEIAVFQAVPAFEVCGDADGSAFEENGYERNGLPRFVGNAAADLCCLGRCQRARQQQRRQQCEAFEESVACHISPP